MKDSGVKWIGEIPEDWSVDKVKYHFENYKIIPGIESDKFDRLALTLKGVIKRDKEDGTGLQPKDFYTYQLLRKNDLVFKLIDLQNISTSRVGLAYDTGIVSPAYIILHPNDVCSKYAEKFFLMMWHREIFNALGDDGVRSSLSVSDLLNVTVSVPPIEEQEQIASFLEKKCSEIDSLHSEIEEQIKVLEEYKKSVITEAVTKGLNSDVEMKDSGIEWIGEIPRWWEIVKVKYLCEIRNEKYTLDKGELDYFALENIVSWNSKLIETENQYDLNGTNLCYKDDVVFGKLRPYLAKTFLVDYDRCCSSEFAIFYNFKGISKYYLYVFTSQGFIKIVDDSTTGVKMPRANIEFIKNVKIPVVSVEEQKSIVTYLENKIIDIDQIIADKQHQLSILEQYKKSLIYEYVTGKKEVPA